MRTGQLRHKIVIEQVAGIRDQRGETTDTWTEYAQLRAGVYALKGDEKFLMHREVNSVTHKVVTRYIVGVTAEMRVNFGGRIFDIESVINIAGRNKTLHLMCIER